MEGYNVINSISYIDATSFLKKCIEGYTIDNCSYKVIYIPLIINALLLLVSFYFFTKLLLNKNEDQRKASGCMIQFWLGVILTISFSASLQLIPFFIRSHTILAKIITAAYVSSACIPYNSVTIQTSKIMKLFSIPGHRLFAYISYIFNFVVYAHLFVAFICFTFYPLSFIFIFSKVTNSVATVILIINKMIFLFCATYTFILSKKTKKSTTKEFRTTISILIFVVALTIFIYFLSSIFIVNYQVNLIWGLHDIDNRVNRVYLIDMFIPFISEILPVFVIAIFMYTMMNIKEEGNKEESSPEEPTVLKGLI
jgi:hypothetical protein